MRTSLRYIFSFLLISAICITTLASGAYVLYGDYSKHQIEEKFQAQLSRSQSQADQLLESILQYQQQLSYTLFDTQNNTFNGKLPNTDMLVSLINNFESSSSLEAALAIFFSADPCFIYTSTGRIPYSRYEQNLRENEISPELSTLYSNLMTVTRPVIYSASPNNRQMILVLPLGSAWSAYPARLVMIIDGTIIRQYFDDIGSSVSLYAIDTLGQLALSSIASGAKALPASMLYDTAKIGIKKQIIDGEQYILLRQASSTGIMTYIEVVPEHEFYSDWFILGKKLMLIVAFVGCFAILLSLIMGYMTFRPVHKAYRLVTGKTDKSSYAVDELGAIVETFNRTKENILELEDRQEINRGLLRHQFTLGLINNTIKTSQEIETYRTSLMMTLNRPLWLSLFLMPTDESSPETTDALLRALDGWQCNEAEFLYAECQWEKGIGIVMNFGTTNEMQAQAGDLTRKLADWLLRAQCGPFLLGSGSVETSPTSVGTSFYRAMLTVHQAHNEGILGVAMWQAQTSTVSHLTLDTALLAEGITYGNNEVAQAAFKELMLRVRNSHEAKPLIYLMCSNILNTITLYSQKQNLPLDKALLCRAAEFRNLNEFEENTASLIAMHCVESGKMRAQSSMQTRSHIIAFIAENYKRNDLSLKMLSDEMGMSMSKINILLKDKLGCSFVQYVSLLRLNEAKRLLRESNESIQNIVQNIGYIDVSSFMRKFKQVEGVSPGQYRTMNRFG